MPAESWGGIVSLKAVRIFFFLSFLCLVSAKVLGRPGHASVEG